MSREVIDFLLISVSSIVNLAILVYQTMKRVPREAEKLKAEKDEALSEAAESNLAGAKISNDLLTSRIAELKRDKRDAWNYIAQLKKQLFDAGLKPVDYMPLDSDPKITK